MILAALLFQPDEAERMEILEGVRSIASPGNPGLVVPIAAESFTIAFGRQESVRVPVAAAGFFGKGRAVAFGHGSYLKAFGELDTGRLLKNAVRWAGRGKRVIAVQEQELAAYLNEAGGQAENSEEIPDLDPERDCLLVEASVIGPDQVEPLKNFVCRGGGIVTAGTGWGWRSLNGDSPLSRLPANRILMEAGLLITHGIADPAEDGSMTAFTGTPTRLHAWHAIQRLKAGKKDSVEEDVNIAIHANSALPDQNHPLGLELGLIEEQNTSIQLPVPLDSPLERIALARRSERAIHDPYQMIEACSTAVKFPGTVPDEASRDEVAVILPRGQEGWMSTGMYAGPGQHFEVILEADGWSCRIGAHTDGNWHHTHWDRSPQISKLCKLSRGRNVLASAYGGLIYLIPPTVTDKRVEAKIWGAVKAPRYVKGRTTPDQWLESRQESGPWAELEGARMIHTIPSEWIRDLDDPKAVVDFWDKVADACADLAQMPRARTKKERVVADIQISGGYMHAGYPIMTHLDTKQQVLDLDFLMSDGSWGLFHEIGHNHQNDDWTFDGTTEVTVNLFTLYVYDTILGRRPDDRAFAGVQLSERAEQFDREEWTFEKWKSDAFMALAIYMQIQERFGWEKFKLVFAEYRKLPEEERPQDDQAKRDQWLVRLSKAVDTNLAPLFEQWRIPLSDWAVDEVKDLPSW